MSDLNHEAFIGLFREAFLKCFGNSMSESLSETESKQFANKIFEETGLVIGAKSLKNYSAYIFNGSEAKQENPSVATLDTLARYVLNAPPSDEVQRKQNESHHPYWFQYKTALVIPAKTIPAISKKQSQAPGIILIIGVTLVILALLTWRFQTSSSAKYITEDFKELTDDSLTARGWMVQSKDLFWWNKRTQIPGGLTLFTLTGDNWPDSSNAPVIRNLLVRKIPRGCFSTEIHMDQFIPKADWQQAGILLMEDTLLSSQSVRFSLGYNDFFGGYSKPAEIIIQGVSSGGKNLSQPEEIAHIPVFSVEPEREMLVNKNLQFSALKIEMHRNQFRFLYSTSPFPNFAYKEAFTKVLPIQPKYIGVFALQGFVNNTIHIPVHITFFSLSEIDCDK